MDNGYKSVRAMTRLALRVYCPTVSIGVSGIPSTGPGLIVTNHTSVLDPVVILATSPRQTVFLAKKELFEHALFRWFAEELGAIPVDRENPNIATARATLQALNRGLLVMITPEGTRSPSGELLPFKPGFLRVAQKVDAVVIPAAIVGTYDLWPRHCRIPRPGKIKVVYDTPIAIGDLLPGKHVETGAFQHTADLVRDRIALLLKQHGGR